MGADEKLKTFIVVGHAELDFQTVVEARNEEMAARIVRYGSQAFDDVTYHQIDIDAVWPTEEKDDAEPTL